MKKYLIITEYSKEPQSRKGKDSRPVPHGTGTVCSGDLLRAAGEA